MSLDSAAPLLFHVGYHKTGTTWFQRELFRPAFGYNPLMTHEEVFARFIRPHGLTFDAAVAGEDLAARRGKGAPGSVDVISSELLVGNPHYGGRESELYARRLKAVAPDAKILITIREQLRMLTSIYMQYVSRSGTLPPRKYFADDPVIGYFAFAPEHFEYHRLIGLYCELFGTGNVLVLTQERLAKDPLELCRALAAFAGVAADVDLGPLSTEPTSPSAQEGFAPVLRRINHFLPGPANPGPVMNLGPVSAFAYRAAAAVSRMGPVKTSLQSARPVTAEVRRRFQGHYCDSNRQLKALFEGRLELPGYPT